MVHTGIIGVVALQIKRKQPRRREDHEDNHEEMQNQIGISSRLSSRSSLISCNFLFLRQDFHFSCAGCANEF
ncbi:MAG: hypothetical protein ABSB74_08400, partial [Tepidisphaeraceae bacterium]